MKKAIRKLLVFDLDKTLLQFNVSFALGRFLYREKKISIFSVVAVLFFWIAHFTGLLSTKSLHRLIFSTIFYRKSRAELEEISQRMFSFYTNGKEIISLIRTSLLEEIAKEKKRKEEGFSIEIGILSTSPDFLVKPFAKALSVDWWSSSKYALDENGLFKNVESVMNGKAKRLYIEERKSQFEREGFSSIVQAYSDSFQDIHMLLASSFPVCVAPSFFLKLFAKIKKWRIVDR